MGWFWAGFLVNFHTADFIKGRKTFALTLTRWFCAQENGYWIQLVRQAQFVHDPVADLQVIGAAEQSSSGIRRPSLLAALCLA